MTAKAFVLMPFGKPHYGYFATIFSPALADAGFEATKADDLYAPRPIMDDIRQRILEADLVLCDMSGRNPNVMYELGLAHAIGKTAILVSASAKDIPFDLQHVRAIVYDRKLAGWDTKLRQGIAAAAREASTLAIPWPPPLAAPTTTSDAVPGVVRVFPNLPSCEQEILRELATSRTVRLFLQLGKTVLVGTPNIYEYLEKSLRAGSTVRILHAGLRNRYLSRRIALERGSSFDGWVSDIEYATKRLDNLRNRSVGVVQSRTHDEAYYWLIFLFDTTAYVQPYMHERGNTTRAPVLKLALDNDPANQASLYRVFDRYFERKWDESVVGIRRINDLVSPADRESKSLAVAAVAMQGDHFIFVIPERYIQVDPPSIQFHAVGGKVNDNEAPHDALVREMLEEIDCVATIVSADRTLFMSSHSDIGELELDDRPAPSHVYKRAHPDSHGQSWLLGYRVGLEVHASPRPRKEISAVLILSQQMLEASVSRRLKVREVLAASDGSKFIAAAGVDLALDAVVSPTGLASIIASTTRLR